MSAFGSFKFILSTKKKFEFLLLKNIIIIIYIVNIVFFAADRDAQQVVDHGLIGKLVKHGSHRVHTAVQDEQRSYNNADVNTTHIMHTRAHSPRSASRLALANGPPSTTAQRQHNNTTTPSAYFCPFVWDDRPTTAPTVRPTAICLVCVQHHYNHVARAREWDWSEAMLYSRVLCITNDRVFVECRTHRRQFTHDQRLHHTHTHIVSIR